MEGVYDLPPIPATIGIIITTLIAVFAVIYNERLKRVPEYIETIIHETGHALSAVPLNGGMPTKIDFFDGAEAEVEYSDYGSGKVGTWVSTMSGYAFPILFGLALIWLTFTPKVHFLLPALICLIIFILQILIGPFFPNSRIPLAIIYHLSLLTLLLNPLINDDWGGSESGVTTQLGLLGFIVLSLFLGSWRHIFSLNRKESRRTLTVLLITGAVLFIFYQLQPPAVIVPFITYGLGVLLLLSGVKTLHKHGAEGSDFHLLAEHFGGEADSHHGVFLFFFLPASTLIVTWVLFIVSFM